MAPDSARLSGLWLQRYARLPTRFAYTFDVYADFLERFTVAMNLTRYALYLHEYRSQIGLRLAMKTPERVAALVIQNGDIYEDQLGPSIRPAENTGRTPRLKGAKSLVRPLVKTAFAANSSERFPGILSKRSAQTSGNCRGR